MRNYPDRFVRHGSGFVLFPLLLLVAACASTGGTSPPVPDLDGSRWVIVAIDGSVPLRGEEPLSVDFSVDGRISGNAGCNTFSGPYIRDDAILRIGEVMSTRRACVDERLQRQEARVLNVLRGETHLRRERDDTISLRNDAGSLLLAPRGYQ
jgi:heat shock protein HslJ